MTLLSHLSLTLTVGFVRRKKPDLLEKENWFTAQMGSTEFILGFSEYLFRNCLFLNTSICVVKKVIVINQTLTPGIMS